MLNVDDYAMLMNVKSPLQTTMWLNCRQILIRLLDSLWRGMEGLPVHVACACACQSIHRQVSPSRQHLLELLLPSLSVHGLPWMLMHLCRFSQTTLLLSEPPDL